MAHPIIEFTLNAEWKHAGTIERALDTGMKDVFHNEIGKKQFLR